MYFCVIPDNTEERFLETGEQWSSPEANFLVPAEFSLLWRQETRTGTQESAWCVLSMKPLFAASKQEMRVIFFPITAVLLQFQLILRSESVWSTCNCVRKQLLYSVTIYSALNMTEKRSRGFPSFLSQEKITRLTLWGKHCFPGYRKERKCNITNLRCRHHGQYFSRSPGEFRLQSNTKLALLARNLCIQNKNTASSGNLIATLKIAL